MNIKEWLEELGHYRKYGCSARVRRPNVMVDLTYWHQPSVQHFTGVGFAKCMWPDEWDAEFGLGLAEQRAVEDLAAQLAAEDERMERLVRRMNVEKERQNDSAANTPAT